MTAPIKIDLKVEETTEQHNVLVSDKNMHTIVNVETETTEEYDVSASDTNIPMMMGVQDEIVPPVHPQANQIHVGTTAEWNEQPDLVGELEHIYVYSDYGSVNGTDYPGMKVGDGGTLLADLPFVKGSNAFPLVDLGTFDIEDYDWEYWNYLNDKVESGFYYAHEEQDGFTYFFRVERAENSCYQEVWSTEEGGEARNVRSGWLDGEEWSWNEPQHVMFSGAISNAYYNKNEVDQKLRGKVDNDTLGNYYTKSEIDNTLGNYYTDVQVDSILEDNYYTSDQIDDMLEGFAPENMVSTTWANLVAKRDAGQLVGGAYYRITDYNFVTSKVGIQSGNHQFDIVVLAISESMLSETAYAARHSGDHYFEREVTEGGIEWLYSIYADEYAENYGDEPVDHADDIHAADVFCDSDYLEHPNTGDVVPVLYKTNAEEYDFDDPDYEDAYFYEGIYDLDGDEYDMWSKWEFDGRGWNFVSQYALTPIVVEDGELIVSPIPETKTVPVNMNAWELKYCLDNDKELFAWADTNGKGVIYYMKDEFGNEAPYDFKNIKYARRYVSNVSNSILNNLKGKYIGEADYYAITTTAQVQYFYTFDDGAGADSSLFGSSAYNTIETWIVDGQKQLNNIVTNNATNNRFGANTHDITISNNCIGCEISGDNNLFYGANSIKGVFRQCTIIGVTGLTSEGLRTSIGNQPNGVKINGNCYDLNFGNNLANAEFDGGCMSITFGNYCSGIKIGRGCNTITFGQYCVDITIGKSCNTITFTNYWRYCEIMDSCSKINMQTSSGSTTNYCQYVTVRKCVTNVNLTPTRKLSYETIYYKTGKTETAV